MFERLVLEVIEEARVVAPAVKSLKTGKVWKGEPGEIHISIYDRIGVDPDEQYESGFMTDEGEYVNRQQAYEIAQQYSSRLKKKAASNWRRNLSSQELNRIDRGK